jgi:hypothetical protein
VVVLTFRYLTSSLMFHFFFASSFRFLSYEFGWIEGWRRGEEGRCWRKWSSCRCCSCWFSPLLSCFALFVFPVVLCAVSIPHSPTHPTLLSPPPGPPGPPSLSPLVVASRFSLPLRSFLLLFRLACFYLPLVAGPSPEFGLPHFRNFFLVLPFLAVPSSFDFLLSHSSRIRILIHALFHFSLSLPRSPLFT